MFEPERWSVGDVETLPPGPRTPATIQSLAMRTRQRPYLERARRRYGPLFTVQILSMGPVVIVADPELIKQMFRADPAVLHAGSGSPLRDLLGPNSLLGIDEDQHLEARRLLLPPFKGDRMRSYEPTIAEIAADEIDRWPSPFEFPSETAMQRITLLAILRTVFGAEGEQLDTLRRLLPEWTALGNRVALTFWLRRNLGRRSPWARFLAVRDRIDHVLNGLIAAARADERLEERTDVLALMVRARHQDGTPMSAPEIRDELVTMLVAGHETTARTLSWAIERLRRHPEVLSRLVAEVEEGGRALRDATIREVQRTRPVIPFTGRLVRQPFSLGGYQLPLGTRILAAACLTHYDPVLFPHPDRFDPDRFLGVTPDTYAWIPFGGGIRRCLGASFAHMEMDVVLRVILERVQLVPTRDADEPITYRGVVWAPGRGGRIVVRPRVVRAKPAVAPPGDATEEAVVAESA